MTEPVPAPIHISVVLDRSGSMQPIADDTVGGFNAFLAEQRSKPGRWWGEQGGRGFPDSPT